MRKIFSALAFVCFFLVATPAHATLTKVGNTITTCPTASANCTLSAISGANHFAAITFEIGNGGTLSSVSGGCSVSWVVLSSTHASAAGGGSVGVSYCLLTSSGTPVTTWSTSSPGGATYGQLWEYSFTGSSMILDTGTGGSAVTNGTSSATQNGVPLTLTGSNDVIVTVEAMSGGQMSSINASYTNPATSSTFYGSADLENVSSTATPVWTNSSASTQAAGAAAFTEVTSAGVGAKFSGSVKSSGSVTVR